MKVNEKIQLLLKGVTFEQISKLEQQELEEATIETVEVENAIVSPKVNPEPVATVSEPVEPDARDLEIESLKNELKQLKAQIVSDNANRTVVKTPAKEYDSADVFNELFNK